MSVFKNVRVSPEGTAGTDNLWRGFQKAFTRELHLRALLLNAGVTIPNVPPMNAIASTTPEPFQVEADLDMPDLVFTITSYGADGRPFPQEPQLHLRHTTVTGEPTGDLIVCAESF